MLFAFGAAACTTVGPSLVAVRAPAPAAVRQVEVTPCVWAAGFDGDVKIGDYYRPEASFSDGLDDVAWTGMVTVAVPLDRWTLFGDASRVATSQTFDSANTFMPTYADVEQQVYDVSVGYRITEGGRLDIDVLAGARQTFVDTRLEVGPVFVGGIFVSGQSFDDGEAWVDAIAGTRIAYRFADRWAVVGHFDAGGGGSQFTTQGIASVDFDISRTFTLKLGYRHLYTDYADSDFTWKMTTAGFFAGVGIRF